jgi:hypothetical protein
VRLKLTFPEQIHLLWLSVCSLPRPSSNSSFYKVALATTLSKMLVPCGTIQSSISLANNSLDLVTRSIVIHIKAKSDNVLAQTSSSSSGLPYYKQGDVDANCKGWLSSDLNLRFLIGCFWHSLGKAKDAVAPRLPCICFCVECRKQNSKILVRRLAFSGFHPYWLRLLQAASTVIL